MGDDLWNFDDDDLGDDATDGAPYYKAASKDCTVLVVDASKPMFNSKSVQGDGNCFELSLQVVRSLMVQKCCGGEQEYIAIVLINTQSTNNGQSFKHIHIWQDVALPNAERVREIDKMLDSDDIYEEFKEKFGGHGECHYDEALWLSAMLTTNNDIRFGVKRVFLFTNNGEPHKGDSISEKRIQQKVNDLKEQDIDIEVVPTGVDFNGTFWKKVLELSSDLNGSDRLDSLMSDVRRKNIKRRAMGNIKLKIADGVELSVGIFNPIAVAKVPTATRLDRQRNEEVLSHKTYFNQETGEKLLPSDMQKTQMYGGQRIAMEMDEVESLKRIEPAGIVLLGFKPTSYLELEHHVRPSLFLRPNETSIRGSTCLFRALLARCLVHDKMALCRMTARANMPPRLVALLPQREVRDEDGAIEQSPGFHIVFLPFAEDLRNLDKVLKNDDEWPKANAEQVDKARDVVKKLTMHDYSPELFHNPVLVKHYQALEAMALDKNITEEFEDQTKPNFAKMTKRAGAQLDAFRDFIFPAGYDTGSATKKRTVSETFHFFVYTQFSDQ
uniref:ATP-dependent DNA helicase 2 subunit 1 n=1 Tax=Plectus sambesii TaxID=2011161 RepID=A0A914WFC3_9BILA